MQRSSLQTYSIHYYSDQPKAYKDLIPVENGVLNLHYKVSSITNPLSANNQLLNLSVITNFTLQFYQPSSSVLQFKEIYKPEGAYNSRKENKEKQVNYEMKHQCLVSRLNKIVVQKEYFWQTGQIMFETIWSLTFILNQMQYSCYSLVLVKCLFNKTDGYVCLYTSCKILLNMLMCF